MNLIFAFCVYMTFIYMPFDIFYKPMAEDEEVWFGFTLHGFWAKATAPLHWLIYGRARRRVFQDVALDVALGRRLRGADRPQHAGLEPA